MPTDFSVATIGNLNAAIASINAGGANAATNTVYTIHITGEIDLAQALTAINLAGGSSLVIIGDDGNGNAVQQVIDGQSGSQRGFVVTAGAVTLENLTIQNTSAVGPAGGNGQSYSYYTGGAGGGGGGLGAGGGLFVASGASATLDDVQFNHDAAAGGAGGAGASSDHFQSNSGGTGVGGGGNGGTGGSYQQSGNPGSSGSFGGGGGGGGGKGGRSSTSTVGAGGGSGFGGGAGAAGALTTSSSGGGGGAGGGGLGAGGDIYVQSGGSLIIAGGELDAGTVSGGSGGHAGKAYGNAIFGQGDQTIIFAPDDGDTLTISGDIADMTGSADPSGLTGAVGLLLNGAGTVVLSGNDSFTGGISLVSGTLDLASTTAAGGGGILFGGTATLKIDNAALSGDSFAAAITGFGNTDTLDLAGLAWSAGAHSAGFSNGILNVTSGGVTDTLNFGAGYNTGDFTLASDGHGGVLVTSDVAVHYAASEADLAAYIAAINSGGNLAQSNTGYALIVAAPIALTTPLQLDLLSGSSLTLSGKTVTGSIVLDSGALKGGVGTGSDVLVASGAVFDLAGKAVGLHTLTGAGTVTNSGAAAILTVTSDSSFTGTIADGAGSVGLKITGGTLTLDPATANSYSGGTQLSGGTLVLDSIDAAGSGVIALSTNVTLDIEGAALSGGALANLITGFAPGDTIDLAGLAWDNGAGASVSNGILSVTSNGVTDTLHLHGGIVGDTPSVASDGHGGTAVTSNLAVTSVATQSGLNAAILAANADGPGNYYIVLTTDIRLTSTLATINLGAGVNLEIFGAGHTLDGAHLYRGLTVSAGTVDIESVTIRDAAAIGAAGQKGNSSGFSLPQYGIIYFTNGGGGGGGGGAGLGGGLYVGGGTVTLSGVNFSQDGAQGGAGGAGGDPTTEVIGGAGGSPGGGTGGNSSYGANAGQAGTFGGGGGGGDGGYDSPYSSGAGGAGGAGGFGGGAGATGLVGANQTGGVGGVGGGGLGAGGDIFLATSGSLIIEDGSLSGGNVIGGSGGHAGQGYGSGIFAQGNQTVTFAPDSGQTLTISDAIADTTGSADASGQTGVATVAVNGAGKVILSGANSYSGGTLLEQGTLELASPAAAGNGIVVFQGAAVLQLDSSALNGNAFAAAINGFSVGDEIDLTGLAWSGAHAVSVSGGNIHVTSNGVTDTLSLVGGYQSGDLSLTSDGHGGTALTTTSIHVSLNVSNAADFIAAVTAYNIGGANAQQNISLDFNLTGDVTLASPLVINLPSGTAIALTGAHAITGSLEIAAGTLSLGAASTFTGASDITLDGGAVLDLGGKSQSVHSLIGTGTVVNNGAAATLNFTAAAGFNGALTDGTGVLAVSVAGGASLTLDPAAANSYSGGTTLNGGTLDLQSAGAAGSGAIIFASGASSTLEIDAGALGSGTFANLLSGFANGANSLDLRGLSLGSSATAAWSGGTLTVTSTTGREQLSFANPLGAGFTATSDGQGGTLVQPNTVAITTEAQLNAAIAALASDPVSEVLEIEADITLNTALTAITLAGGSSLGIEGNGHTIDGAGTYQGFVVNTGTVVLDNITIKNAKVTGGAGSNAARIANHASSGGGGGGAGLGGGLFIGSGANVVLSAVNFTSDNAVGGFGGSQAGNGTSAGGTPGGGAGGGGGLGGGFDGTSGYTGLNGGFGGGGGGGGGGGWGYYQSWGAGFGAAGGFGGGAGGRGGDGQSYGASGGYGAAGAGGGGLGAGGDIFISSGGSLIISAGSLSGGSVTGGLGGYSNAANGTAGSAYGSGIFIQGNQSVSFAPGAGQTLTINDVIADTTGSHDASGLTGAGGITVSGAGKVVLSGANTYTGLSLVNGGHLELASAKAAGGSAIQFAADGMVIVDNAGFTANALANIFYGFSHGDIIDLAGLAWNSGNSVSFAGGQLAVTGGATTDTLNLLGIYQASQFFLANDGQGGTDITVTGYHPAVANAADLATAIAAISSGGSEAATNTSYIVALSAATTVITPLDIDLLSGSSVAITAAGSGTITLGGPVTVDAGTLTSATTNIFAPASLTLNGNGTLDLAGLNQTVTALNGAGRVTDSGVAADLTVTAGSSFSGSIADGVGAVSLVITGGITVLNGHDSYSGGTTLSGSTLDVRTADAAGGGAVTFSSTAASTLEIDSGALTNGHFANTIANFDAASGDVIDLRNLAFDANATAGFAGGVLSITSNGVTDTLNLNGVTSSYFGLSSDGHGGTDITSPVLVNSEAGLNAALAAIDAGTSRARGIAFTSDITLNTALTAINLPAGVALTIDGEGHSLDGANAYQGFVIINGVLQLGDLTIANAVAQGATGDTGNPGDQNAGGTRTGGGGGGGGAAGMGGGLFVGAAGTVTLTDVNFTSDAAKGGAGGNGGGVSGPSNGGGYAGNGGASVAAASGIGGINSYSGGSGRAAGAGGFGAGGGGGGGGGQDNQFGATTTGQPGATSTFGGGGGGGGGGSGAQKGNGPGGAGVSGGFGAGAGGNATDGNNYSGAGGGGGGGAGLGGDIFVAQGGSLTIGAGSVAAGTVSGGAGGFGNSTPNGAAANGTAGTGYGNGIFIQGNQSVSLAPAAGDTLTIAGSIADVTGSADASGLTNAGGLVINGAGTVDLTAANSYTGATTVNSGTLLVDGTQSHSAVTVDDGAILGGHGTTGAVTVNAGGIFAPGNSPGQITVASLNLAGSSSFEEQLGGTTAGSGYDQTVVQGSVSLGDAILDLSLYGGFTPGLDDSFTIIDNQGSQAVSGMFTDGAGHALTEGAVFQLGGFDYALSYSGGDGNDVVLTRRAPPTLAITSPGSVAGSALQTIAGTIDVQDVGLTVSLYDGATLLGTATPDSNGDWSANVRLTGAGVHVIKASVISPYDPATSPGIVDVLVSSLRKPALTSDIADYLLAWPTLLASGLAFHAYLTDTAANIAASLNTLEGYGHIALMTASDPGDAITLSAADYAAYSDVLAKIGSAHQVLVTGISGKPYNSMLYTFDSDGASSGFTEYKTDGSTYLAYTISVSGNMRIRSYAGSSVATAKYASYDMSYDLASGALTGKAEYNGDGLVYLAYTITKTGGINALTTYHFTAGSYFNNLPYKAYDRVLNATGAEVGLTQYNADGSVYLTYTQTGSSDIVKHYTGSSYDGRAYVSVDVAYGAQGDQLSRTKDNRDGTHQIAGLTDNVTLTSIFNDSIIGGGVNETFVMQAGFGHDNISDFAAHISGASHDTVKFTTSEFTDFNAMLAATKDTSRGAVLTLATHDTLTLLGVTKAMMTANPGSFLFGQG